MASAHPDRLAACLDVPLSRRTLRRLQQCERLHARLNALLVERWEGQIGDDPELGAGHAGTQDPPPSLLEHPDIYEIARLAGAVWHSRSLKSLVSGTVVGELVN